VDSGWSTAFNNFEVDTRAFPDFTAMVMGMHAKGVRVIVWATSMVSTLRSYRIAQTTPCLNSPSASKVDTDDPDYPVAVEKGYLVKDVLGKVRPIKVRVVP
jgi:alpha-glucosidase (family GH31 glycosyl hydrolase)